SALVALGSDPVLSLVAMLLPAITVAICSNVDSFFALSFASTFTTGSIVAFLLTGPVVDIKMIALMRTTFSARTISVLVAIVLLAAFTIGAVANLVV
ncbi:MAG: permease, partial [Candidatus Microbacterium stercoravium]